MDGFYSFLFYGLIAVGAVLIIPLTILRIDWARHPEKYEKDVENYEKEQYWKKKRQDKEAAIKKAKEKEKAKKRHGWMFESSTVPSTEKVAGEKNKHSKRK